MTDKVQKIREEVKRLKSQLLRGACSSQIAMETMCKEEAYNEVLAILDTMQEEPVSEDVVSVAKQYIDSHVFGNEEDKFTRSVLVDMFCSGANWQKTKDESITDDLGEYINELSKQFPEVSFAKLSRIAVRVAKWQKERFEKNRLAHCDALTEEQAQIESDFVTKHLKENSRTPTFIDAIEYGIKMQEEQMMAKAIDGEVTYGKSLAIPSLGWVLDKEGLDYGDKVKLIIIKED